MIKSLRLKNFESHENSYLEFDKGFNIICGLSDTGKSSIVRALALITDNSFDKAMVSLGSAYCEIEVVTERGSVTCQRGEEINRWIVVDEDGKKHLFEKIGRNVPELASRILGMKEKTWGKKLTELPNFIFQNEKHYMVSEIGGEKSSSNMIARLIDGAIGLGGMEELIKEMSGELTKNKKQMSEYTSKVSEMKSGLESESEIEKTEKKLQRAKTLFEEIKNLNNTLTEITAFLEFKKQVETKQKEIAIRLNKLQNLDELYSQAERAISLNQSKEQMENLIEALNKTTSRLDALKNIDCIASTFETLNEKTIQFSEMIKLKENFDSLSQKKNLIEKRLVVLDRLKETDAIILLEEKLKTFSEMENLQKEMKALAEKKKIVSLRLTKLENLDELEEKTSLAVKKIAELEESSLAYELYSNSIQILNVNKEKIIQVNAELEKNLLEESNLRKVLGVCPVCDKPFTEEHKEC